MTCHSALRCVAGCWVRRSTQLASSGAWVALVACGGGTTSTEHAPAARASAGHAGMSATPTAGGAGGRPNVPAGGAPNSAGAAGAFGGTAPATGGSGAALGGSSSGGAAGLGAAGGGAGHANGAGTSGGTAAGNGGGAGAAPLGALTLTGLKIEANPNMTISCFVSWTTAEPASSEVDFGETSFTSRIRDMTLTTDHRVLVIGMHAQKAYKLKAVSATATASGSVEGTFTTGMLP